MATEEDSTGAVWLSYQALDALLQRHQVPTSFFQNIEGVRALVVLFSFARRRKV